MSVEPPRRGEGLTGRDGVGLGGFVAKIFGDVGTVGLAQPARQVRVAGEPAPARGRVAEAGSGHESDLLFERLVVERQLLTRLDPAQRMYLQLLHPAPHQETAARLARVIEKLKGRLRQDVEVAVDLDRVLYALRDRI